MSDNQKANVPAEEDKGDDEPVCTQRITILAMSDGNTKINSDPALSGPALVGSLAILLRQLGA